MTISLTKRWKKLGTVGEVAVFVTPDGPGRAVWKVRGDEIWMRWEPNATP